MALLLLTNIKLPTVIQTRVIFRLREYCLPFRSHLRIIMPEWSNLDRTDFCILAWVMADRRMIRGIELRIPNSFWGKYCESMSIFRTVRQTLTVSHRQIHLRELIRLGATRGALRFPMRRARK